MHPSAIGLFSFRALERMYGHWTLTTLLPYCHSRMKFQHHGQQLPAPPPFLQYRGQRTTSSHPYTEFQHHGQRQLELPLHFSPVDGDHQCFILNKTWALGDISKPSFAERRASLYEHGHTVPLYFMPSIQPTHGIEWHLLSNSTPSHFRFSFLKISHVS